MERFAEAAWKVTVELAPALLLGLFIAGILHVLIRKERVFRHLGRPGPASVVKASLFGVPLPLCSCGVIPAAMALRREGASRGATTAFLVSTPQTGVDSVMVTAGMLGWPVAAVKLAAAFTAGLAAGVAADAMRPREGVDPSVPDAECVPGPGGTLPVRFWRYVSGVILRDLYRWLFVGIVVSALITVLVPEGAISGASWAGGPLGMLAALAIGIPLYVCSTASVPIAAGLVSAGLAPGAALVFLMAGPATNAATIAAVRRMLGNRIFLVYLGSIILVSLLAGLLLDGLVGTAGAGQVHGLHLVPGWLAVACAVILLAGMGWWALSDLGVFLLSARSRRSGREVEIVIEGATCRSCEERIRAALLGAVGVKFARVDREKGRAWITCSRSCDPGRAVEEVRRAGYGARLEQADRT